MTFEERIIKSVESDIYQEIDGEFVFGRKTHHGQYESLLRTLQSDL